MKILLINTYLYQRGGDCTYTFSLGNLFKTKGHKVFYWGMKHPLNYELDYKDLFVDYIDYENINASKNIENALKVFSRCIYYKAARKKLKLLINIIKPDIVHLNNIHAHLTPSIIDEIKNFNIPVVWTLHDFKLICPDSHLSYHGKLCEDCKNYRFYNCLLKRCKKGSFGASFIASIEAYIHSFLNIKNKVNFFISPSKFLRNKFIEFGWQKNKIIHIYHFLTPISVKEDASLNTYILYYGEVSSRKGISTLINAVKELKNIELKIAGEGTEKKKFEDELQMFNIKNITFLGYKTGSELQNIIKNSLFVIAPSELHETLGYSILESMSLSKPVIASNIGAYPELVVDGKTGLLFESGNYKDLKSKIEFLYNNQKKINELGNNAKERILEKFSSEVYYKKIINVYRKAIGESK
jgi:glycosyltransferase involved in cell wall biosynthesis